MSLPNYPKSTRFIGFQAFELLRSTSSSSASTSAGTGVTENLSEIDKGSSSAGPATSASAVNGPSYPLDVYAPLVPNPVPLNEITVLSCFPVLLQGCKPPTTAEKDARLGPWVRVDRPLDPDTAEARSRPTTSGVFGGGGFGWFNSLLGSFETKYLFYRRSRRSDVPRVVDIRLVETGSDKKPTGGGYEGWHRVKLDLKSTFFHILEHSASLHLYYKTVGGTAEDGIDEIGGGHTDTHLDYVTEIDVTYGPGPVWPDFESIGIVTKADTSLSRAKVTLSARRKPHSLPAMPVSPLFKQDGTFKIIQVADLHLSVQHEHCREVDWESKEKACVGDTDTLAMMERWLDEEKPDLVVLSGDQLNGQFTSWDEKSVIPKYLVPIIKRKIPWASIMGNHDSEFGILTRREQQILLSRLPYSISLAGPEALHDATGAGNYYAKLHSPTPDNMHLFTLYFVDSGVHAPRETMRPWKYMGYDYIRWDQIDWFLGISNKVAKIARPYTPDGAKDLPPLWNRTSSIGSKRQGTHLSKPKALFFTHIPVPEAFDTPDKDANGKQLLWGHLAETLTLEGAQKNKGIFGAIVAQQQERDVIGLFHGHMHNNDGCRRTSGVYVCFNGGSSFAGYGKLGLERKARVIEIFKWGEQVDTWHRMERTKGRVEEHRLYDEPA